MKSSGFSFFFQTIPEKIETMLHPLFFIFTLCQFASESNAIFLPYWSKRNHSESSFHIPFSSLALENSNMMFGTKLQYYQDLVKNYSLDYRCANGLPISIAWHQYSPYTTVIQTKYKGIPGLTVDGMFPGILNLIVSDCCHKDTRVSFGKLLKSVRNAEKHIQQDTFDMTFPLYGYDASSDSFR